MRSNKAMSFAFGVFTLLAITQKSEVMAQIFTVGQLERHCRSYLKLDKSTGKGALTKSQTVDVVKCTAFIGAFHYGKTAANALNETLGPYCLPSGLQTTNWMVANFVRWVKRHPRQKKKVAGIGIMRSLQERYGCDERDRIK